MAQSIIDDELRCSKDGIINYATNNIKLNKKLLLIGDEMQDLSEEYIKAIIKITRDRYVDFYGVGDLLQSISIKKNSFRFLCKNELPNDTINIIKFNPSNICRRFNNKELINFVNLMIPFKNQEYNLPEIQSSNITEYKNSLTIFSGITIFATDKDEVKIKEEIEKIMEFYNYEVIKNNYKPNDFLIVTPYTNKNPLVDYLNNEIRTYWNKKYNDFNYNKYSVFHKSDTGSSIDLSESDEATRIVSIHSSKGDGRPVVFLIGINESVLKLFSYETNNLIYDSLFHVALTRMKKKLYIRFEENNDDIHHKIMKYFEKNNISHNFKPCLKINNKNKIENLVCINIEKNFNILRENIINFTNYNNLEITEKLENKNIIDMKHHLIRYIIYPKLIQDP